MKKLLWHTLEYTGLNALQRHHTRNDLTIVLYHGVDEKRDLGTYNYRGKFISPDAFSAQLAYLKQHYKIVALDEAIERLGSGSLPKNALALTFDDGYRNNYTHAFPLLKEHEVPATIFITTDFVDAQQPLWVDRLEYAINTGRAHLPTQERIDYDTHERNRLKSLTPPERARALHTIEETEKAALCDFHDERAVYAPLTWDNIQEMSQHNITFGAHTQSHPILSKCTDDEARNEIAQSQAILAQHDMKHSNVFAYPNGQAPDQTTETCAIVRALGFSAALTTVPGCNTTDTDRYLLHRYTIDSCESLTLFTSTISGARARLGALLSRG